MDTLFHILGWILMSVPFIGLLTLMWMAGGAFGVFVTLIIVGIAVTLMAIIDLAVWLISH